MSRMQWKLFTISMLGLFGSGILFAYQANQHPFLLLFPPAFMLLLLGSTLGWSLLRAVRNFWNRRHGVQVIGHVIHARASGYSNHVPTWEVEAVLPDGSTTELLVTQYGGFTPGEPITLVINPRDRTHAVLPATPSRDF